MTWAHFRHPGILLASPVDVPYIADDGFKTVRITRADKLAAVKGGAALFDGKRLVVASRCELHPKYQALRPPRSKKAGCSCAEIYSRRKDA